MAFPIAMALMSLLQGEQQHQKETTDHYLAAGDKLAAPWTHVQPRQVENSNAMGTLAQGVLGGYDQMKNDESAAAVNSANKERNDLYNQLLRQQIEKNKGADVSGRYSGGLPLGGLKNSQMESGQSPWSLLGNKKLPSYED